MIRILCAALAASLFTTPACAATIIDFESDDAGSLVNTLAPYFTVEPAGIVAADGPTGNFLELTPPPGPRGTAQLLALYTERHAGEIFEYIRTTVYGFDVMFPTGGRILIVNGGPPVTDVAAGQWIHFARPTTGRIGFQSSGTVAIDNIAYSQFVGRVPEPAIWGMMLIGFGAIGASLRMKRAGFRSNPRST